MKKILTIIGIATMFAACTNNPKTALETNKQIVSDTSRLYNNNLYTDTARTTQAVAPGGAAQSVRQVTYTDNNGVKSKTITTTTTGPVNTGTRRTTHRHYNHSSASTNNSTASNNNGNSNGGGYGNAAPARKRGWSKAAKGAVIGGVGGAVAGAIIDKKHGQGAIIGGVVGAAGGYIIGRGKDKKDGRIQ